MINIASYINKVITINSIVKYYLLIGLSLLNFQKGRAQFTNAGELSVKDGGILSIYEDYMNKSSGSFINDGDVYVFKDWKNDGNASFNKTFSNGKTFFMGTSGQFIEGDGISDFENIIFSNNSESAPFYLGATISVNNIAEFDKGIINAVDLNGLIIFNENATHQKVHDGSFVDGRVQKNGKKDFLFPVGAVNYLRPAFQESISENNSYTTQYFFKNSDDATHSHLQKEESILKINNKEYWEVEQTLAGENIVLTLTLDQDTTPEEFLSEKGDTKVVIVRWDEQLKKWVNENGALSDAVSSEGYSNLLTTKVKGYGLFTTAIVEKEKDELVVYNSISPNGDGLNDKFYIKGISKYPDNKVEIYNRWGVKVYETKGYNETDNMFEGYSDGRATISRNEKLPAGTYFYILNYNDGKKAREKTGYLYINSQ
ncbi:gliding motility-associated C-terminal domain-containing protein [Flavobacterium sp. IB48]|uniref:gliding motility-associated C-terminal domain-containing protein n=1 Tax=Flavobacterium sp. IB48 TaxID=2779375 RepID=UPI0018E83027|nr:gliding motility-associated C-terminal domain-containing protein [Flavobacterium sp. IB48]MBJ2126157.1 gliding motility-associated C-terminal domain-containing protein [Flavobacterium sp. IB48]